MSTTTVATPATTEPSWTRALRAALLALAIVVLLTVSFAIGRATVSTAQHVPAIAPAASVKTSVGACPIHQPC